MLSNRPAHWAHLRLAISNLTQTGREMSKIQQAGQGQIIPLRVHNQF